MTRSYFTVLIVMMVTVVSVSTDLLYGSPRPFTQGPAAYYSKTYTHQRWVRIYNIHKREGRIANNAIPPSKDGYHCVHADIDRVGVRITLRANGITIPCVTADMVHMDHKKSWRSRWAIELSWAAFKKLKLDEHNVVNVYISK